MPPSQRPATGLQFTARVARLPEDTFAVVKFELEEWLSKPFSLTLKLASVFSGVDVEEVLDQPVTLSIFQNGEPQRHVQGIVYGFDRGETGHRRTRYTLTVVPALERLTLMHNSRIFQQQDSQQIIQTLLTERGMVNTTFNLRRSPQEREYCVQHRESDFDFLTRLAAEEGWHYRFDANTDGQPLVLADHHRDAPVLPEAIYNATAGGSHRQACVRGFRHREQLAVARTALQDYTFRNPDYALIHDEQAAQLSHRDDYEHYDYPGRFKRDETGQPLTKARLDSLRNDANWAKGDGNRADFTVGARFPLTDHTHAPHNRDWLITYVKHTGEQPQALEEEGGEGTTTYNNDFSVIPGDQTWRPQIKDHQRPRMPGPQMAIVTGPQGEEIHCDEHGRVKVRFPWDRRLRPGEVESAENNEHSSAWLRVSQGWAGDGYGFMALPRIGHEVIVSFLNGDPDQPLITGRTYHASNRPPETLPEHKTRTTLKTQTHKGEGSNELRFEDEADQQQIYIHAQKDLNLLTENDRTEVIRNNCHLTVDKDRTIHVKSNDHRTVTGEHRETVGKDSHLTLGGTLHQKATSAILSEAGNEVHHKAGNKVVLDAGAELTIAAGGSFLKLDASGVTMSGPTIKINSGGAPGSGSGQAVLAPGLPPDLEKETGDKSAPVELADVDERPMGLSINPASQQAALEKGAALTPVCESPPEAKGEMS